MSTWFSLFSLTDGWFTIFLNDDPVINDNENLLWKRRQWSTWLVRVHDSERRHAHCLRKKKVASASNSNESTRSCVGQRATSPDLVFILLLLSGVQWPTTFCSEISWQLFLLSLAARRHPALVSPVLPFFLSLVLHLLIKIYTRTITTLDHSGHNILSGNLTCDLHAMPFIEQQPLEEDGQLGEVSATCFREG